MFSRGKCPSTSDISLTINIYVKVRMKKAATPDELLNTEIKIVDEV